MWILRNQIQEGGDKTMNGEELYQVYLDKRRMVYGEEAWNDDIWEDLDDKDKSVWNAMAEVI
jgi:hypothetical protein